MIALSVVIPAHDAAATLPAQLDALLAQRVTFDWEVVVVDNASSDATHALVEAYAVREPRVRLVSAAEGRGPSYARNTGIAAARGTNVACCDADDVVADGWLAAMDRALATHEFVAGALALDRLNDDWVIRGRGRAIERCALAYGGVVFAHGCNFGIRRDLFLRHHFDETLRAGEEVDLALRLAAAGVECHFAADAVVHYRYRTTVRATWRQAYASGRVQHRLAARAGAAAPTFSPARRAAWLIADAWRLAGRAGRIRWVWVAADLAGRMRPDVSDAG